MKFASSILAVFFATTVMVFCNSMPEVFATDSGRKIYGAVVRDTEGRRHFVRMTSLEDKPELPDQREIMAVDVTGSFEPDSYNKTGLVAVLPYQHVHRVTIMTRASTYVH